MAETKFKKGDKVVCISANPSQFIKIGKIYTILDCYESENEFFVKLNEIQIMINSHSYYMNKFKLANSTIIRERLGVK